ncbi:MAG: hypothetical protein ABI068_03050 [Ktedonobacterales bacterium]
MAGKDKQLSPIQEEEARKELMATLAASRELGPEMDHTLVDRYIEEHVKAGAGKASRAVAQQPQPQTLAVRDPNRFTPMMAVVPMIILGAIVVAAIVTGHIWLIFALFWLGPMLGFGMWGRRNGNRRYRRGHWNYYNDGVNRGWNYMDDDANNADRARGSGSSDDSHTSNSSRIVHI